MFHLFVNQTNVNCVLQTCLTFTCILFGTAPQLDTFEVKLQVAFHTFWAAGCQCTCNSISQSAYHLREVYLLIFSVQLLLFLRMSPVMVRGSGRVFPLCVISPPLCRAVLVLSCELHLELINAAAFKSSFDNYLSPKRQLTSVSIRRFMYFAIFVLRLTLLSLVSSFIHWHSLHECTVPFNPVAWPTCPISAIALVRSRLTFSPACLPVELTDHLRLDQLHTHSHILSGAGSVTHRFMLFFIFCINIMSHSCTILFFMFIYKILRQLHKITPDKGNNDI